MILIMVRSKTFNLGQAQQFIDQNVPKPRAISSNSLVLVFMNTLHLKKTIVELLLGASHIEAIGQPTTSPAVPALTPQSP